MRALAALAVVIFHFRDQIVGLFPGLTALDPLVQSGYLGVDLFFPLSGFILAFNYSHALGKRPDLSAWASFYKMRFARVWPVHFFALNFVLLTALCARALGLTLNSGDAIRYDSWAYIENLLAVHAWFGERLSFNAPAWSISAEAAAYLLFPAMIIAISRCPSLTISWGGAALSYASFIAIYSLFVGPHPEASKGSLVRIGFEFTAGCFLFKVWERTNKSRRWSATSVGIIIATVSTAWATSGTRWQPVLLPPFLGLVVLCLANSTTGIARILATRPVVKGGEASYALYMTHDIVHAVLNKLLHPGAAAQLPMALRLGLLLAITLLVAAAAAATYSFVERPARERLRGRTARANRRMTPAVTEDLRGAVSHPETATYPEVRVTY